MIQHQNILWFAGCDWWVHNPSPEKHWAERLAHQGNTILFINSIGVGLPRVSTVGVVKRLIYKLTSLLRYLRHPSPNLWVLTPIVLPFWSMRSIEKLNQFLLLTQIHALRFVLGIRSYIFWAGLPTPAVILPQLCPKAIVYYYQDNYTAYYEELSFRSIELNDDTLFRRATAVICASLGMFELKSSMRKDVYYIPHGVDEVFLNIDLQADHPMPQKLSGIRKPFIGYWGSLESLQDQDLLRAIAYGNPDWSVILIGNPLGDFTRCRSISNIHFIGPIPLSNIPEYGIHFDVCIMSFVQNEWITYSCPVKYREYLALGKPIVSVPIIEVEQTYGCPAAVASTNKDFISACVSEMANDSIEKRLSRRSLVEHWTWDHTTELVSTVIQEALGSK